MSRLEDLTPEELVSRACDGSDDDRRRCLEELYTRFHPKVLAWSTRVCGDRERASDIAQEVFVRVQEKLGTFRGASRFSTWLYTVTRRVAINRMQAESLRRMSSIDDLGPGGFEPATTDRSPEDEVAAREIGERLREAIRRDLDPTEARVLYLHYVDGLTLPAITGLLGLENASGAKAYIVGGKRKLKRTFGRWLAAQDRGEGHDGV